jgi:Ca2+-binding RTX toxin-like protein
METNPLSIDPVAAFPRGSVTGLGPALADLGGDSRPELVLGAGDGTLHLFRMVEGRFVAAPDNPFAGIVAEGGSARPAFADLDGDGLLDLVLGGASGTLQVWRATAEGFVAWADSPLAGIGVGGRSWPAFGDLDGDGDLDLVVGSTEDGRRVFANTPDGFVAGPLDAFGADDGDFNAAPTLLDIDGDGLADVLNGEVIVDTWYRNTGTGLEAVLFDLEVSGHFDIGVDIALAAGDLDGDGDQDLVVGTLHGQIKAFENTRLTPPGAPRLLDDPTLAQFVRMPDAHGEPLRAVVPGRYAPVAIGDIDGDGAADLVVCLQDGPNKVLGFRFGATGLEAMPASLLAGTEQAAGGHPIVFADLDGDGVQELILTDESNRPLAFRTGPDGLSPLPADWLAAIEVDTTGSIDAADMDGDGDLDLIGGSYNGPIRAFENTPDGYVPYQQYIFIDIPDHTADSWQRDGVNYIRYRGPIFDRVETGSNLVSRYSQVMFADLDGDGHEDLTFWPAYRPEMDGLVRDAYRWTSEGYVPFTVDPFGSAVRDPMIYKASFGDIDGDGDEDLITLSGSQEVAIHLQTAPDPEGLLRLVAPDRSLGVFFTPRAEDSNGDTLAFSLTGPDAGHFVIDAATGALSLRSPLRAVAPRDADRDGTYRITLHVSDGALEDSVEIAVTLQDRESGLRRDGRQADDLLQGHGGADTLLAWHGDDTLRGGAGNDYLEGFHGNDSLAGDGGADTLRGGLGDDRYRVDSTDDVAIEVQDDLLFWGGPLSRPEGSDTVLASADWTLGDHLEALVLLGAADLLGTGNGMANVLAGNAGANLLRGEAGDDRIAGGAGADTLDGGAGRDRLAGGAGDDLFLLDAAGGGTDAILDFTPGQDRIGLLAAAFGDGFTAGMALVAGEDFVTDARGRPQGTGPQLIWQEGAGRLWFDADGTGAGARLLLATLQGAPALSAGDILLV